MAVQLIGDELWLEGWRIGALAIDLPATVRFKAEALFPRPPVRYVHNHLLLEGLRKPRKKK